jgi:hypothetical protein
MMSSLKHAVACDAAVEYQRHDTLIGGQEQFEMAKGQFGAQRSVQCLDWCSCLTPSPHRGARAGAPKECNSSNKGSCQAVCLTWTFGSSGANLRLRSAAGKASARALWRQTAGELQFRLNTTTARQRQGEMPAAWFKEDMCMPRRGRRCE